jgi:glycosyltransferase involved in cell wall biosynthesis
MDRKRVVLIGTSTLAQNTRASKEVKALLENGYMVTFLGWNRGAKAPTVEEVEGTERLTEIQLRLKAPLGTKIVLFYPFWWCFVFFSLILRKWDIAHAINLDSIPPTVIAGKLKRKPAIYEIVDGYEDALLLPKLIRDACIKVDKLFMWLANAIVIVDEMQIEAFNGIPNSKVVVVYDSPADVSVDIGIAHQRNSTFTLFYGGILSSRRALNLDKFFAGIKSIEDIRVVIAGWGDLVEEIKGWSRQMPDTIQFIGAIGHTEVLRRAAEADLLFVLRSPIPLANKYICGSKLLEAMVCGKPILVNKGTSTARKVSEENCGLVIDVNNIEEIREAIIKLRDNPALCQELGANARKAYEQKYAWHIMEQRLLNLYDELTGKA